MLRPTRSVAYAALAAIALAALPASSAEAQRRDRDRYGSWIDTTFAFARGGLVDAGHVNGDITITTWDRPEVRVRAWAEEGRIIPSFSRSTVRLRIEGERRGRETRIGDSAYEITVPVGTRVKAGSVSGDVRVEGTRAEVEASSVSGDMTVDDTEGLTSVTTVSGDVVATRVAGDLTVRSVSGELTVRGVRGDVRASTVSGEVELQEMTSRAVTAKSTSGDVRYVGALERGGRYEFNSHSGTITLRLPDDASADVSLATFSGSLDSDFPVTLGGGARTASRRSGRDLDFVLGDGGARLSVQTFSGDVRLERASGRARRDR